MAHETIFIGWNRSVAGRENQSIEAFSSFVNLCTRAQKEGHITSFEPVALEAHGGDLNGFCTIKGDQQKLWAWVESNDFQDVWFRALYCMQNLGLTRAYTGEDLQNRMSRFAKVAQTSK